MIVGESEVCWQRSGDRQTENGNSDDSVSRSREQEGSKVKKRLKLASSWPLLR